MSPVGGHPPARPRSSTALPTDQSRQCAILSIPHPARYRSTTSTPTPSREQLSIKTKKRDARSPLSLAAPAGRCRRPRLAPHARQFSSEPRLLRSFAVSSRAKLTIAKGFSFVPIEDPPSYYVSAPDPRPAPAHQRAGSAARIASKLPLSEILRRLPRETRTPGDLKPSSDLVCQTTVVTCVKWTEVTMSTGKRLAKRSIIGTRVAALGEDGLYYSGMIQAVKTPAPFPENNNCINLTPNTRYTVRFDGGKITREYRDAELIGPGFRGMTGVRLQPGQRVYLTYNGREVRADVQTHDHISDELRVLVHAPGAEVKWVTVLLAIRVLHLRREQVPPVINRGSGRGGSLSVFGSDWVTTPACSPLAPSNIYAAISISKNREATTLTNTSRFHVQLRKTYALVCDFIYIAPRYMPPTLHGGSAARRPAGRTGRSFIPVTSSRRVAPTRRAHADAL
ncbi:unnamed protein product [Diatraea saccharalis]|uniref:DUF4772 domain-containing protein n=1 Tax=Diatraea saccharalis TaxID=40085 RepID=A0A9N9N0Z2_9NEOP|nr:unnamed protein product [Diatraea saccharalis]